MDIDTTVSTIMTQDVITVSPEESVTEVARLLWENKISGMPVVENEHVVGMITEYDLIARESEYDGPLYIPFLDAFFRVPGSGDEELLRRILATSVRELMSMPVITVESDATVQDVATIMYEERINGIPVVDSENQLLGIVSRADIVRLMVAGEEQYQAANSGEM
jgi:CBS domain-containing protein